MWWDVTVGKKKHHTQQIVTHITCTKCKPVSSKSVLVALCYFAGESTRWQRFQERRRLALGSRKEPAPRKVAQPFSMCSHIVKKKRFDFLLNFVFSMCIHTVDIMRSLLNQLIVVTAFFLLLFGLFDANEASSVTGKKNPASLHYSLFAVRGSLNRHFEHLAYSVSARILIPIQAPIEKCCLFSCTTIVFKCY